ncbi:MAG: hypothetical protein M2R45_04530 [Verrucomicrobia subdivision 3 bacterium]|nr:hypothetical protein [Limisphaerales bacterium]MCS1416831.1 hypothetical protein [Limisphaerales bacterium]
MIFNRTVMVAVKRTSIRPGANYLYANGHMKTIPGITLYNLFDIGKGVNFSAPPELRKRRDSDRAPLL